MFEIVTKTHARRFQERKIRRIGVNLTLLPNVNEFRCRRAADRLEHDSSEDELNQKRLFKAPPRSSQEEGDDHSISLHRESQDYQDSEPTTSSHTSPSGSNNEQNADSTVVELLKKLVLDSGVIKRTLQNIEGRLEKLETVEHKVQASGQSCVDSCLIPHPFSTVADFQAFDTFWMMIRRSAHSALSFKRINSTEKAIEKSVSEWFRHSGDRIKQQNNKLLIKPSGSTSTN
ncbi:hypothetical protein Ocin01_14344 [Orchesella cincta]|uniref:Uncharacterized protein n=1 Tax=Orchesella cincta TaxID=48709 RepID=A0A1D2MH57_ORCCI|nr:hypothetical protein Ocin01_14344 [Orchesella cincta]